MPIDDATWAQVRAAYIANEISITAICAKFELTSGTLYKRRIQEGWPLRGTQPAGLSAKRTRPKAEAPVPSGSGAASPAKSHAASSRATRGALILRLYNAIDLKLTQMEKLMTEPAPDKPTSSADHERETRALTGLIRNFERVTELNADLTSPARSGRNGSPAPTPATDATRDTGAPANAHAATSPASAEQLRRDIAQRLERLMGKGNPSGNAG